MKKLLIFLTIFIATITILPTAAVHADNAGPGQSNNDSNSSSTPDRSFLGLVPWNFGLPDNIEDEGALKASIWKIAANVAEDIAIIASYLVLGYVIYGGYQYTFSGGDPNKVATGKKTLYQAFLGLAITLSATLIMSTIRFALFNGGGGNLSECAFKECVKPSDMITGTINWFIGVAGVISAIFIVYGAIMYITSAGDSNKVQKAKQMITYSLIGLAIVALAATITAFVSGMINNATDDSTQIDNITLNKGVS